MPLTKIHLREGRSAEDRAAIAGAVQEALVTNLGIAEDDLFQVIQEYGEGDFRHSDAFGDLTYTRDLLMIEISFIQGRSDEVKKGLLADLNDRLVKAVALRPDDVFVILYDVGPANVSFGRGLAQKAP
jgi:phenylpyruvate tautomerase PptA (4-oxalocrotonate tautomerase family)